MPDEQGNETREEALERIRIVRATQIFGDTPTDPTIGDVVVPAHDEEGANVAAAAVADQVEDGDEEAADLSQEEAKRQLEPLSAEDVQEGADEEESAEEESAEEAGVASEEDSDDLSAAEKIERLEAASSAEEVDSLADGDERVTVQRAADKKRDELSE